MKVPRAARDGFWTDDRGLAVLLAALVALIVVPALGPVGLPGRFLGDALLSLMLVSGARRNRLDLSVGIALGSAAQIALFVAPVLVFASYWIGPAPMDLVFTPAEVIAIVIAVAITGQIASDGESHWLEGVQLLAVYLILALIFFALPEALESSGATNLPAAAVTTR